jgi:hypothetical protein
MTDEKPRDANARMAGTANLGATAIVYAGLPGLSPEGQHAFYEHAIETLPLTRIKGFFGVTDGSEERDDDAVIFLYSEEPLKPTLRLALSRNDFRNFVDALISLREKRFK